MKAGISLPRGQLRVEWNLTPRLRSTWGLLHASHSIKEFSFWNRQIIKSKTVATAVNLQGIQENWAYMKWRANSASTEESFSILTCWLARLNSMGRAGPEAGEDALSAPRLAHTKVSGLSTDLHTWAISYRIMRAHKTIHLHQLEDPAPGLVRGARKPYLYFKMKHRPSQLQRKLEKQRHFELDIISCLFLNLHCLTTSCTYLNQVTFYPPFWGLPVLLGGSS